MFIAFGNPSVLRCKPETRQSGCCTGDAMFSAMCKFSNCNFLNRQKSFDKGTRKTIAIETYIVRDENTVKNLIGRKATLFSGNLQTEHQNEMMIVAFKTETPLTYHKI